MLPFALELCWLGVGTKVERATYGGGSVGDYESGGVNVFNEDGDDYFAVRLVPLVSGSSGHRNVRIGLTATADRVVLT